MMRDYFQALIQANDARYEQTFKANALAATTARTEQERWLTEVLKERDIKYDQRHQSIQESIQLNAKTAHEYMAAHEKQDVFEHAAHAALCVSRIDGLRSETFSGLNSLRESMRIQLESSERAISKAEVASEKGFANVNEFRGAMGDQARMLIPRREVEVMFQALTEKIETQNKAMVEQNQRVATLAAAQAGKQEGQHVGWGWAVSVIGLVLSVASLFTVFSSHLLR